MGQARARGTYAERKAEAIERNRKLAEERYGDLSRVARRRPTRLGPRDRALLASLGLIIAQGHEWANLSHRLRY